MTDQNPAGATPPAYDPAQSPTPPPAYDAAPPAYTGGPGYAAPSGSEPGKTLGIVALVVVFFFSLIGLILGYVARSQSKKAGVTNTPAKVAIILGWIFLVLSIIVGIIIAVVTIAGLGAIAEACEQFGPGTHQLTNGGTITCG